MTLTTVELESYVSQIDPNGPAHHIPLDLLTPPAPDGQAVFKTTRIKAANGEEVETFGDNVAEVTQSIDIPDGVSIGKVMTRERWNEMFIGMHEAADFGLAVTLKQPTNLGAVAASEHGAVMSDLSFDAIQKSPWLQKVFWADEAGMIKIGMAVIGYSMGLKNAVVPAFAAYRAEKAIPVKEAA